MIDNVCKLNKDFQEVTLNYDFSPFEADELEEFELFEFQQTSAIIFEFYVFVVLNFNNTFEISFIIIFFCKSFG